MSDLISRQAAIDAVISLCDDCDSGYCGSCRVNYPGEKDARNVLDELPSAQPEVIRCKDCKYLRQNYIGGVIYCDRSGVDNNGDYVDRISYGWGFDDFCSHAERRDDRDERSV